MSLGYIVKAAREEVTVEDIGVKFDVVAETELHTLFAEAVVCGQADSLAEDVELTTGMVYLDPAYEESIHFFNDPRFGYYKRMRPNDTVGSGPNSTTSVSERLRSATTRDEVRQIITGNYSLNPQRRFT